MPPGFVAEDVATGLGMVTDFAFLPGNRILVTTKQGQVLLVNNGTLSGTILDISWKLGSIGGDRGLIGLAAHPNWPTVPFIYLGYVLDSNPSEFIGRKYNILSRFTFDPAASQIDPNSEMVMLGACQLPKKQDWFGDDCMPQDGTTHTIDWISFGPDGNLWVATGDGETFEGETWPASTGRDWLGPMDPQFLGGKILRLNPESGDGLPDNPFFDGNPKSAASRVWATGLRNPFRCSFFPSTNPDSLELMCGVVGWFTTESIVRIRRGGNLGWPCWEGNTVPGMMNADFPGCKSYLSGQSQWSALNETDVPYAYAHNGDSAASIGGLFLGAKYPAPYSTSYLFADFPSSQISALEWDFTTGVAKGWLNRASNPIVPRTIAKDADQPVSFKIGPDGWLHYLGHCVSCSSMGVIRRIRYNASLAGTAASVDDGLQPVPVATTGNETAPIVPIPGGPSESCKASGVAGVIALPPLPKSWDAVMYIGQFPGSKFARNGDGMGPVEVDSALGGDKGNDGKQLTVGGVRFSKGLGTAQVSEVHAEVNGNCFRFRAAVGIDDQTEDRGATAELIVKLDGRVYWNSTIWNYGKPLKAGDPPLNIDIKGLQLVADVGLYGYFANGMEQKPAALDWGDARIFCGPESPFLPEVVITKPEQKNLYKLNDTVEFAGSATDHAGNRINATSLTWYINLLHCQGALCHTHFYVNFQGVEKGNFTIVPHPFTAADQFIYFEVRLVAMDTCGRTNQANRYVLVEGGGTYGTGSA